MKKVKNSVFKNKNDVIFYSVLLILPIVQFLLFYVYVNINTVLLAFQKFDGKDYVLAGFENFAKVIKDFAGDGILLVAFKNSLIYYIASFFFGTMLTILFAYYIYKERFFHGVFKTVLFLPSIISSVVLVIMYRYFVDEAIPKILNDLFNVKIKDGGLYSNLETQYAIIFFYNLFVSFAGTILIYYGSMKNMSDSVVEAAQLDGANAVQEFIFVTMPSIYGIFVTFMIGSTAGLFTNQLNMYSFRSDAAPQNQYNLGYYMYITVLKRDLVSYPYLAAMGTTFSIVAIAVTYFTNKLLTKFGPSVD